jgi:prepilin-type N-terminal cleavage/methylation domain-containing protein
VSDIRLRAAARSSAALPARSPLRNRATSDAGVTLVELMVAMALTAVVSTLLVSVFVSISRSTTRESLSSTNSETATVAMRELSRIIRAGTEIATSGGTTLPVFLEAGANTVTLHAFTDTGSAAPRPVVVSFRVIGGVLTETRRAATTSASPWTFAAVAGAPRTVARGLGGDGATSTFTYLDAAGSTISPPAGGVLTATQRASVAAVTVRVRVQGDATGLASAALLENTVGITNLRAARVGATG